MKIGILCERFHPLVGGTETLAKGLAEFLTSVGEDVTVITSPNLIRKSTVYRYGFLDKDHFLRNQSGFDCIVVFADPFNPTFHKIDPSRFGCSLVVMNINEDNEKILSTNTNLKNVVVKKMKQFSKIVSFCKNSSVNRFLLNNNLDFTFINNFSRDIIESNFRDDITKERLGINKKIMIYHAAVEPSKNQIKLIEEFSNSEASRDYDLVLVGSARNHHSQKYYNSLKELVDKTDGVHLFKETNKEEIINSMLRISDVFIMPSLSEGLPISILEAMSANLFWISTPVGGIPGTLGELNGGYIFSHPSFTSKELDEALSHFNNKSREEWSNNFRSELVCQEYYNLIKELV